MTKKATQEIISTILRNDETVRPDVIEKITFALTGKNEPVRQKYFNLKEIAIHYGISRTTAYEWISKGILKPIIINETKRYELKPLQELQKNEGVKV
jgi:hypothetical protein